jgi:hypothetical protein
VTPAAARLGEAVERFKIGNPDLDENAKAVLERLVAAKDNRAAHAIAGISNEIRTAARLVLCCVQCDALSRTFHSTVAREEQMPARLDALTIGTKNNMEFIRELAAGPRHPLIDASVDLDPVRVEYLLIAQNDLLGLIEKRRQVAAESLLRFGRTQKRTTEDAGMTAALGFLAEGIEHLTGRPHYEHAATLGEIVLGMKDSITIDRVRDALRTRRERPWRQK